MADQHTKGAVDTVRGTLNEGVAKLTGDKSQEAKGKIQKVEGKLENGLGDVQSRGRWRPVLVSAVGAVIVLVVARLLTGSLRIARNPG